MSLEGISLACFQLRMYRGEMHVEEVVNERTNKVGTNIEVWITIEEYLYLL